MSNIEKIQALEVSLTNLQNAFQNAQQENIQLKEEINNLKTLITLLQFEKNEVERSSKLDSTNSNKPHLLMVLKNKIELIILERNPMKTW